MSSSHRYCVVTPPRVWWRRVLWNAKQWIRSAATPRGDGRDYIGWSAAFLGSGIPGETLPVGTAGAVVSVQRQGKYLMHCIDLSDHGECYATLPAPEWALTSPDGRTVRLRPWSWEGLKYRIIAW